MWQEAIGWMSFGEIKMGEMIISNKVYISEILRKGTNRMFHRIRERKPIPFLYCVVLPFWESAVLEIYEYHELLSDLYEEKEVVIVGLAAGKEDALVLVRRIMMIWRQKERSKTWNGTFAGKRHEHCFFDFKNHRSYNFNSFDHIGFAAGLSDFLSNGGRL